MGILDKIFDKPERGWLGPEKLPTPPPGVHYPPGAYIKDWRVYKLEDAPELLNAQRRLAARGLHSPWLRNEVYKYDRKLWGSKSWRTFDFWTFGWRFAIPMLIVTAIYEFKLKKPDDHHGGAHHDDAHH